MRSARYSLEQGPACNIESCCTLLFNVPAPTDVAAGNDVIPPQSAAAADATLPNVIPDFETSPDVEVPASPIRRISATAATCMGIYVVTVVLGWSLMAVLVAAWFRP
jgi:hypothetical protein